MQDLNSDGQKVQNSFRQCQRNFFNQDILRITVHVHPKKKPPKKKGVFCVWTNHPPRGGLFVTRRLDRNEQRQGCVWVSVSVKTTDKTANTSVKLSVFPFRCQRDSTAKYYFTLQLQPCYNKKIPEHGRLGIFLNFTFFLLSPPFPSSFFLLHCGYHHKKKAKQRHNCILKPTFSLKKKSLIKNN